MNFSFKNIAKISILTLSCLILNSCRIKFDTSCNDESKKELKKHKPFIRSQIDSIYLNSNEELDKIINVQCDDSLLVIKSISKNRISKLIYFDSQFKINKIVNTLPDIY